MKRVSIIPIKTISVFSAILIVFACLLNGCATRSVRLLKAIEERDPEEISKLLEADDPKLDKTLALVTAIEKDNEEAIKLLLESGSFNMVPGIMSAISNNNLRIVKMLISCGLEVNGKMLFHAVKKGHIKIIEEIAEKGADPNFQEDGTMLQVHIFLTKYAMEIAMNLDHQKIAMNQSIDLIRDIMMAEKIVLKDSDPFKGGYCIDMKVNPDGYKGKSTLSYAIESGNIDVVHLLLKKGANPNLKYIFPQWEFHGLFDYGSLLGGAPQVEMTPNYYKIGPKYYILGLPDSTYDNQISTLLSSAIRLKKFDGDTKYRMVEMLIQFGADPNIPDDLERTPLWHAEQIMGHTRIIKLLKKYGAKD